MEKTIMNELKFQIPEGYEIDLSKSDFPNVYLVFKKKEFTLPKTYDELEGIMGWRTTINSNVSYAASHEPNERDLNLFASPDQARASLALAQLSQLREVYRQGWKPNWDDGITDNWCLYFYKNEIKIGLRYDHLHFLSFQSQEIAEEFLNNFKDLILQANPLMS